MADSNIEAAPVTDAPAVEEANSEAKKTAEPKTVAGEPPAEEEAVPTPASAESSEGADVMETEAGAVATAEIEDRININKNQIGKIIGQRGSTIQRLEMETGCNLQVRC